VTVVRRTNHWRGVAAVALLAGAVGLLLKRPAVLLAACVGVGYVMYPRLRSRPAPELALTRRLDDTDLVAGDPVTVTVTLTNAGQRTLHDVRIVDGVPPMLSVTDGQARQAAVLSPGAETSFTYEVTARYGTHQFRPATVLVRDVSGGTELETTVAAETDELVVRTTEGEPPVGETTERLPGHVLTDGSGEGLEFARTREYRPGDSPSRVDWKHYARTGSLATVEYLQERSVTVSVCVDARAAAYVGRDGGPHAVSYGVRAALDLLESVWAVGEVAGVSAIGREFCWLAPGRGTGYQRRARRFLFSHPTLSPTPPADDEGTDPVDRQLERFRRRLDAGTQVVLVSPLSDAVVVDVALELAAADRTVTVVSPDVGAAETLGGRVAAAERRNRLQRLRRGGVRVVDWDPSTSLAADLFAARERWC
jgi:uncharacterized repeat protein (TIGR01451 family)